MSIDVNAFFSELLSKTDLSTLSYPTVAEPIVNQVVTAAGNLPQRAKRGRKPINNTRNNNVENTLRAATKTAPSVTFFGPPFGFYRSAERHAAKRTAPGYVAGMPDRTNRMRQDLLARERMSVGLIASYQAMRTHLQSNDARGFEFRLQQCDAAEPIITSITSAYKTSADDASTYLLTLEGLEVARLNAIRESIDSLPSSQ